MEFITGLFDTSDFPARWWCGYWTPAHGWLHILSDVAVWAAYFAIPLVLGYFATRRRDLPFRRVFLLFVAFILLCGTTHLMEAIIFWWPAYRLAGVLKLLTAVVSWVTVLALVRVAPVVLAMRTPEELEREVAARTDAERRLTEANAELERRVEERTADLAQSAMAVAEEKERLRTTLASIGDAVICTDRDGIVTYLNGVAETLTGWTSGEAGGVPLTRVFQIVNEDTRQPVENPALRALSEGVVVGLANHTILIGRDGTERPIDDSAAPIRCRDGEVVGSVLVFRDITARHQAEQRLQRSEERFRATFEQAAVGLAHVAPDGRWLRVNGRMCDILGYAPDELLARTFQDITHPDDLAADLADLRRLVAGEITTYSMEKRYVRKDRSLVWATLTVSLVRTADGRPDYFISVVEDITARKDAEERLRASEQQLRLALEASAAGTWRWDADAGTSWDDQFHAMYGLPAGGPRGLDGWLGSIHPDDRGRVQARVRAVLETPGEDDWREEFRAVHPAGERWMYGLGRGSRDAAGRLVRMSGLNLDVTERKEAERAIRAGEERLRTALTAARMVAWEWTPADGKFRVSENAADVFGLPAGVVLTGIDQGLALLHPDDEAAYRATVQKAIDDRGSYLTRYRLIRPDDRRVVWAEERGHAVFDQPGGGVRVYGVTADVTDRHDAEAAVRASEEKYRTLFESMDEGYCVIEVIFDPPGGDRAVDYRFLEVNPAFAAQSGLHDATGRRMSELAPAIEDHWLTNYCRVVLTGEPVRFADEYKTLNRWFDVYAFRVGGGGSRRVAVLFTDITVRRQAERAIRESEARHTFLVTLADTLRPLSDPMAVQAEASRVLGERLGANRVAYFEVRGGDFVIERDYTAAARPLAGRYPVAAFGPALLAAYLAGRTATEADVDALASRPPEEKEAFAAIQTRAYVGVPLVKGGAFVAGLAVHSTRPRAWTPTEVAMIEDTAERTWAAVERVRAEHEVARLAAAADRERRLFDTALSNTADFNFIFGLDGGFVYANRSLLALWGKTAGEATGKTMAELGYPPDVEAQLLGNIRRVAETGREVRDETPYTSPTGASGHYEYALAPVFDAGGAVVQVVGSARDITDRRRVEEELRRLAAELSEANRRKDEFLATLAHELRNPLAPIRNGLQVIRMAGATGTIEQARSMMERQLGQMVRLVDDLLDVSRVTTGKLTLRTERLELRAVIDAALETTRTVVEQAGHDLAVAVPGEPIFVEGDLTRLAQVVSNLLTNSAKYTHRGGHIRLAVERDGDSAVVSVRDDGIGIPPAMLDKVFVMFTQVDRTLEKTTGGLGIGLSLVKGLVEMHGGTIAARSEGESQGSEFVVRLPVVTPAPAISDVSDKRAEDITRSGLCRILVVDDNADAADSLGQLLEILGNEVRTAYDGEAGVAAAGAFRPAVVLCDIGMPKLNGYEAARRIRAEPWGKNMVLVALTGWGQEDDRKKSTDAGFDHHLVKPVEAAALMKLLAGLPTRTP